MAESNEVKSEVEAISVVHAALSPLSGPARKRVMNYVSGMLDLGPVAIPAAEAPPVVAQSRVQVEPQSGGLGFQEIAELFDAAGPTTDVDRALVAGYWLQVCEGAASFTAQAVSSHLANLGFRLSNITRAFSLLKDKKPAAHVLQLKKEGTSQQARKTYKLSNAGMRQVQEMIRTRSES